MALQKFMDVKVEKINFKDKEEHKYGNKFRCSILISGEGMENTWISLGDTKKDVLTIKEGAGFTDIGVGSTIDLLKAESREYNGKTYYDAKRSNISWGTIVKAEKNAPAVASQPQQERKPFNVIGMQVGHNLNCSVDFIVANNEKFSVDEIVALSKKFHAITEKMKAERKQRFPQLSDYDVGASVGQAVKAAASLVNSTEKVEQLALQILEASSVIEEWIKTGGKEEEKPVVEKPKEDKPQQPKYGGGFDDMDDDIPF